MLQQYSLGVNVLLHLLRTPSQIYTTPRVHRITTRLPRPLLFPPGPHAIASRESSPETLNNNGVVFPHPPELRSGLIFAGGYESVATVVEVHAFASHLPTQEGHALVMNNAFTVCFGFVLIDLATSHTEKNLASLLRSWQTSNIRSQEERQTSVDVTFTLYYHMNGPGHRGKM